ncbi:GmrSD restriction endonuclease domain-containing protein [Aeromonas veronii]|uniref:GmrSD restriction endonuclease domain-containing protein n=1 Tax=Aeromonas veronii TaxID=654 RepID=UPI003A1AF19A
MKLSSDLYDSRINARNILIEVSIGKYIELIKDAVDKNIFQRKRVQSSKTVYALLKEDLIKQCIIPPIVLALTTKFDFEKDDAISFQNKLTEEKDHLVILDGLQRTHTMLDLVDELMSASEHEKLERLMESKIRVEIYIGLNRLGILYRMLTLNTGQTPMSLRQQIEMLYLDYLEKSTNDIQLFREVEEKRAKGNNQYSFKDVIEGFNSYLDRDELPIEKSSILENINSLEKLSKENQGVEIFEKYLNSLHTVISKITSLCDGRELGEDYSETNGTPFGKTATQVFKKSQSISGFGAAVGKLIDFSAISDFDDINKIVNDITLDDPESFLEEVNNSLLWLKDNSKKIGNAQRSYFAYFFRDLFNKDSDTFKNLVTSSKSALRKYKAQNS